MRNQICTILHAHITPPGLLWPWPSFMPVQRVTFVHIPCIALFMFWFDRHSKDNCIHVAHNTPLQPFLCIPKIVPAIHVLIPWCLMNTLYYAHSMLYSISNHPQTKHKQGWITSERKNNSFCLEILTWICHLCFVIL